MDSPLGNSSLEWPVPCQESVHPPLVLEMLLAPSPTTKMVELEFKGRVWLLFFSNTIDSLTACRATARCSAKPSWVSLPAFILWLGSPFSKIPEASLTRSILRTASSSRSVLMVPSCTWARVFSYKPLQLSGAINISTPALKDCAQSVLVQPGTCPCPFQSPTTNPLNPILPLSTSVSSSLSPCNFRPFQLLKEAITVCTPAGIAL